MLDGRLFMNVSKSITKALGGKLLALIVAGLIVVLAIQTPSTAWATENIASPQGTTATGDNNVTLTVDADLSGFSGYGGIQVAVSDRAASNVPAELPANHVLLANFRVSTWGELGMDEVGNVTLTFYVGREYAGATAYVYIEHESEPQTTEVRTVTISREGTCSITVDRLSYFSIVVDTSTIGAAFAGTAEESVVYKNDSQISPQTGVSVAVPAAILTIAVSGLVVAMVTLRKKARD